MLPLLLAILTASLIGNLHCAGMCGAFVAFALRLHDPARAKQRAFLLAAYNVGRLVTYVALGAAAGAIGSLLDRAGAFAGISRSAAILAAGFMIVFSSMTLLRLAGRRVPLPPLPRWLQTIAARGHESAASLPPVLQAFATGLLTTLLPCGWLYAFVTLAAGTGSAWLGAAVMATFWLGTLPVLVTLGLTLHKLTGPLARRLPAVTTSVVLVIALYTLALRLRAAPAGAAKPAVQSSLAEQARDISQTEPSCCAPAREGRP